jgi:hypothetical protein
MVADIVLFRFCPLIGNIGMSLPPQKERDEGRNSNMFKGQNGQWNQMRY